MFIGGVFLEFMDLFLISNKWMVMYFGLDVMLVNRCLVSMLFIPGELSTIWLV